ncbi:MAG TPA: hypothetical protein DER67_05085 [Novosphingobium sp.]|nr:hypothetical protein [Novosphingobium sp.]
MTEGSFAIIHCIVTTRDQILACARAELERSGIAGFSLRRVSAAAGLTPMAIYWHFKNREALLAAVASESFAVWQARAERIPAGDPVRWLQRMVGEYLAFSLDQPQHFDACFVFRASPRRRQIRDFRADQLGVVALMVRQIETGQASGRLTPGDPLEFAFALWAQVHGLVMLHRSDGITLSRTALLSLGRRCADRLLQPPGALQ